MDYLKTIFLHWIKIGLFLKIFQVKLKIQITTTHCCESLSWIISHILHYPVMIDLFMQRPLHKTKASKSPRRLSRSRSWTRSPTVCQLIVLNFLQWGGIFFPTLQTHLTLGSYFFHRQQTKSDFHLVWFLLEIVSDSDGFRLQGWLFKLILN